MKTNTTTRIRKPSPKTFEGGKAARNKTDLQALERSVLACMLFEDSFYESGESIANRIKTLIPKCDPSDVALLAIKARTEYKLRSAPLLLVREMIRYPEFRPYVANTIKAVVQRPDQMAELLSLYWLEGKKPLANCLKSGLAECFERFDEYSFAKYRDEKSKISLRDVMFLVHPKPAKGRGALYKRIANNELKTPDTWEVRLSSGENKKDVFTDLIEKGELRSLALLRNLRNMKEAGVDNTLIKNAILEMQTDRVLPYRFIAANRYSDGSFKKELEISMLKCMEGLNKLSGKTLFLIDVSGSMNSAVGGKSDLTRIDAACGLAMLGVGICKKAEVYTFSDNVVKVNINKETRGFALADAINNSQRHSGTQLRSAIDKINQSTTYDRIVVLTDEQTSDGNGCPLIGSKGYIINVAAYQNGVGYGNWTTVSGFSEAVLQYIQALEKE